MKTTETTTKLTTLGEFKAAIKGRTIEVLVFTSPGCGGYWMKVSRGEFLRQISADVSFKRGGLHDSSRIDAVVQRDVVMVSPCG
jgi:hypothetical protein